MQKWQCRVAPSLGKLEGEPADVWGTVDYTNLDDPAVFFGVYGLPDFYAVWRHKGRKAILWAGSDIRHFKDGYWLDESGTIRLHRGPLAEWLDKNVENYVENEAEWEALQEMGIDAEIIPSFMGDVNKYQVQYAHDDPVKVYASVSGNDFELYGWDRIEILAADNPDVEFHLYGNTERWETLQNNVMVHGRVPKEQMNKEIALMQGGLRPVEFDGFSEVLAKSILWGQYPISLIPYEYMLDMNEIWKLKDMTTPNIEGREHYLEIINNYPWNVKDN